VDVLGIDIGGVIISRSGEGADTQFFTSAYLETPPVPGAIEAISRLAHQRFDGRAHLVSKCGAAIAAKSREWLDAQKFFDRTGIPRENMHFCPTRQGKAPICERLGITHFVDDRADVLNWLTSVPHRYQLDLDSRLPASNGKISRVPSWDAILDALLPGNRPQPSVINRGASSSLNSVNTGPAAPSALGWPRNARSA
jgi:hypothetical protein